ncbi:hypothetical protein [Aeromonas veronii]|uniref:hypothetical protein n=1 Tax=Aeromonas veronii TaxID=654 RepID=UPI002B47D0AB|nr:hypothetical protein [Aeromonas veronii]
MLINLHLVAHICFFRELPPYHQWYIRQFAKNGIILFSVEGSGLETGVADGGQLHLAQFQMKSDHHDQVVLDGQGGWWGIVGDRALFLSV